MPDCTCYICRGWRALLAQRDERIHALELYVAELEEELRESEERQVA